MSSAVAVNAERLLSFSYKDSQGRVTDRELTHWKETSTYIQGRVGEDAFYRTFRKDRVLEYYQGAQHLLLEQAPPPPVFSASLPSDVRGQILFTGFKADERASLEALAQAKGLRVVKTPSTPFLWGQVCESKSAGRRMWALRCG